MAWVARRKESRARGMLLELRDGDVDQVLKLIPPVPIFPELP